MVYECATCRHTYICMDLDVCGCNGYMWTRVHHEWVWTCGVWVVHVDTCVYHEWAWTYVQQCACVFHSMLLLVLMCKEIDLSDTLES